MKIFWILYEFLHDSIDPDSDSAIILQRFDMDIWCSWFHGNSQKILENLHYVRLKNWLIQFCFVIDSYHIPISLQFKARHGG